MNQIGRFSSPAVDVSAHAKNLMQDITVVVRQNCLLITVISAWGRRSVTHTVLHFICDLTADLAHNQTKDLL